MLIRLKELNDLEIDVRENGEIHTLDHKTIRKNGRLDNRKGKKLKPGMDKYGYLKVVLTNDGIRKNFAVHKLVAMAFIENNYNKPTINHINGIKTDNRVGNLEWATHHEQKVHSIENGLCVDNIKALRDSNVRNSKRIKYSNKIYLSIREASRSLGIHSETIKKRGGIIL